MRLRSVRIIRYRTLRDVTWEPGAMNVVIGANGAGKSNLLRALASAKNLAAGRLSDAVREQGGFLAMAFNGELRPIEATVEFDASSVSGRKSSRLRYVVVLDPLTRGSAYRIAQETLEEAYDGGSRTILDRTPTSIRAIDRSGVVTSLEDSLVAPEESALPLFETGLLDSLGRTLLATLDGWRFFHDLRVDLRAPVRDPAVTQEAPTLNVDGGNLTNFLHTKFERGSTSFRESLESTLAAALGPEFDRIYFPPSGGNTKIGMEIGWKGRSRRSRIGELSDGVLRFIMIVAALTEPQTDGLIAIDQPELGMHPGLLPIIAEAASVASQTAQVVFTTHSPELMDAFGAESPPDTTVVRAEQGATSLSMLTGDDLRRWLADFSLGRAFRSGELEALG